MYTQQCYICYFHIYMNHCTQLSDQYVWYKKQLENIVVPIKCMHRLSHLYIYYGNTMQITIVL